MMRRGTSAQTPDSAWRIRRYLPWIILALAVVYFAVAWLWKRAFIWGESGGLYWLFIVTDWTVLPLSLRSFSGFVSAVTVWLRRLSRREPTVQFAVLTSGVLLLASLSFLGCQLSMPHFTDDALGQPEELETAQLVSTGALCIRLIAHAWNIDATLPL